MATTEKVGESNTLPPVDLNLISEKEKQELITAETVSIASDITLVPSVSTFNAVKKLDISAQGIAVLRLPFPPSELQIGIHNKDGSIAYQSTRAVRSSGNCVLTDAMGKQLIATEYFFGPGKDSVLHILNGGDEKVTKVETTSKWTSRSQTFRLPDGRTFTWDYKKEPGFGTASKRGTALVMSLQGKRVAILLRNDDLRTPGSKACSAGNGGELQLGEDVGAKFGVSEEVVIASCLLMLKKEIDRRRMVQFLTLAAVVS